MSTFTPSNGCSESTGNNSVLIAQLEKQVKDLQDSLNNVNATLSGEIAATAADIDTVAADLQNTINSISATSCEVENMIVALNEKMNSLMLQSKADLQELVTKANELLNSNQYPEALITELTTALNSANAVLENVNSTDEDYKAEIPDLTEQYNSIASLKKGDVNFDSNIGLSDVIFILKKVIGKAEFNERSNYTADMNSDGRISVMDAIMLQKYIINSL